ncbi:MAG: hypothetical protein K2X03_28630 [Bryobacteraceae bacterium]|nr:hypothetical protein [Bryobacteraceae bacterium]
MARLAAILVTLAKLSWRDLRRFNSLGTNNFFLFAMLIFGMQPSNAFLPLVLGLILLFPLSADPLGRVPVDRLGHWPLNQLERGVLRAGSLLMSPIAWITLGLMAWGVRGASGSLALGWRFLALGAGIAAVTYLFTVLPARLPHLNALRLIPVLHHPLAALMAKNARELLGVLDTYLALLLALAATLYRLFGKPLDPEAFFGVSLLVVLALSTIAQSLLALDGPSGFVRYQLMPLRGWQVLLAKDVPLIALALLLNLGLSPLAALAAILGALAVGHHPSVVKPRPQKRWRFASGASLETCALQIVLMLGAGTVVHRVDPRLAVVTVIAWVASLIFYGYALERDRG